MKNYHAVAWALGALPLALGISIFALWVWLRAPGLEDAGLILLFPAGPLLVATSAVCMGIDIYKARRTGSVSRKRLTLQTLALAALLASNFLAAGVIVNKAFEIMTRYTASVANHSSLPLQAVRIHGGGTDATLGDIPPGEQKHASL